MAVFDTFLRMAEPGLKLSSVDEPLLLGIDQTTNTTSDLMRQSFEMIQVAVIAGSYHATLMLTGDVVGLPKQQTNALPDSSSQ